MILLDPIQVYEGDGVNPRWNYGHVWDNLIIIDFDVGVGGGGTYKGDGFMRTTTCGSHIGHKTGDGWGHGGNGSKGDGQGAGLIAAYGDGGIESTLYTTLETPGTQDTYELYAS